VASATKIKKAGFNFLQHRCRRYVLSPKQVPDLVYTYERYSNENAICQHHPRWILNTASSDYDRKGASASLSDVYTLLIRARYSDIGIELHAHF